MAEDTINTTGSIASDASITATSSVPTFHAMQDSPNYLIAAANHAIPNGDLSIMDETPLIHGVGGAIAGAATGARIGASFGPMGAAAGAVVGAVTGYDWRFTAASTISGVSQFANSVAAIANVLPGVDVGDKAVADPHAIMAALDDNLDEYYTQHETAVDAAGFIATSLIPGAIALKGYKYGVEGLKIYNETGAILNAWETGQIGKNIGNATGLLAGTQARLLAQAEEAFMTSGKAFTYMDKTVLTALAAGAGEQAIQGMVMEAGVQVMMNKSPLLEDQDYGDIAHNMLKAGMLGGAIGGAVEAVTMGAQIKKALGIADLKLRGHEWQQGTKAGTPLDEQILANIESRLNLSTTPVDGLEQLGAAKQAAANNKIDDDIRLQFQELTGKKDAVLANMLHEEVALNKDLLGASNIVLGLKEATRVNELSVAEKALMPIANKVKLGQALSLEEQALFDNTSVKYLHLWGENAGDVKPATAGYTTIWDTLKPNEQIKVNANNVQAGGITYQIQQNKLFDMSSNGVTVQAANARDLWAIHSAPLPNEQLIHEYDLPLLRKAYRDLADFAESGVTAIKVEHSDKSISILTSAEDAMRVLDKSIIELRDTLLARSMAAKAGSQEKLSVGAIAELLNVKPGYIDGTLVNEANHVSDIFAMESHAADYIARTGGDKVKRAYSAESILLRPKVIKLVHDTSKADFMNVNNLPLTVYLKQQQKVFGQVADRAAASVLREYAEQFPTFSGTQEDLIKGITRAPIGGSTLGAADSGYGTAGSFFERIGHVVNKMKQEASNKVVAAWDPVAYKVLGDTDATMELSILINKIRSTPERYIIDEENSAIVIKGIKEYEDAISAGEKAKPYYKLDANAEDIIPIKSKKVLDTLISNRDLNAARIGKFNSLRSVAGPGDSRDGSIVYFPPPDTKDYPFFALVTDPSITGTGHVKMIHAATEQKLEEMIALVPEEFQAGVIRAPKVKTKEAVDRWHKAIGEYNAQDVMSDSYFDAALFRTGAAAPYILKTDGKLIVDELRKWHIDQEHKLLREAVSLKYFKEFQELKNLGDREAAVRLSSFTAKSAGKYAKEQTDNPYMSYIRTALDLPNTEQIPLRATQDYLDKKVSQVWETFTEAFRNSTSVADLDKINSMVQAAGIKTINYDATNIALANHTIPRGALSTFTRRGNAILASIILKPDVLNAVNNMVGSIVLLAPETHSVIEAIKRGDEEAVGALAKVAHVKIPGTEHSFFSTAKLIGNAIKMSQDPANRAWALERGISVRHSQEVSDIVDTLALTGKEYALDLDGKITLAYDKAMRLGKLAEQKTGNSYAEESTRLWSALVMKQLTDTAVERGLMSPQIAESYIQTFVNRTNGNYLASQRPMMFNGPVGQAVGLFQTYMLTFMQQGFRHVAEGSTKSLALMTAAQGSIYGMASLPGFQQLNTALVGSFSGNRDNKDIYDLFYGAMDKDHADWMMYGALSNVLGFFHPDLKMNMYVRGDANPRNISVVPLNPLDYPIATASAKFFGNLVDTMDKIFSANGLGTPPVNTILQGLEHNGLSRPLSGIAQVLEGLTNSGLRSYSTTSNGGLISANDLFSVMSLTRLSGAKPLDDAKALDLSFRQIVYRAKESDAIKGLGEVIKTKIVAGEDITADDLHTFQMEYVKIGGKQEGFNRFFKDVYKDATVSLSNKLSEKLSSPESQKMQLLMGGRKDNDLVGQ